MQKVQKNEFRKNSIKKLKFCSKFTKLRQDKYISNIILKIIKNYNIKNILLYLPLHMEVDLRNLIIYLKQKNYNVYVPFIISANTFKIVPYRLPLTKKKYNIYEPNNSFYYKNIKLDLAIVPIVGIDDSFKRIGFGVGFYDRYFASLSYKPKIIFTQLCLCKSKKIITKNHDIQGELIVTNKGILWKDNY
jgi:5-formyltetrahydrofolate cyclo-ligase